MQCYSSNQVPPAPHRDAESFSFVLRLRRLILKETGVQRSQVLLWVQVKPTQKKKACELLAHTWLLACVDQPRPCLGRLAKLGLLILLPLPRGVSAADCLSLATCRLGQHSIDLRLEAVGVSLL